MVFTTHLFIFYYLSLFLLLYYALPFRARTALIAACSYIFYGWANPLWAVLMFLSSGVDYVCGLVLLKLSGLPWERKLPPILPKGQFRSGAQKAALIVSIASNMGLLAFFKYYGFAAENLNSLSEAMGFGTGLVPMLQIVLPIGISFYTFKSMSYTIDVYRGDGSARPVVHRFRCFIALFPQLVAGPIIRYNTMADQLVSRSPHLGEVRLRRHPVHPRLRQEDLAGQSDGPGRGRRVRCRIACTRRMPGSGSLAYAFQIYFDFSGYSDMAIGLGRMIGFEFLQELRFSLPGREHHGLLAALAHLAVARSCATIFTFRWAAIARAPCAPTSTSSSSCCWAGCGTARTGRSSSGAAFTGSCSPSSDSRARRATIADYRGHFASAITFVIVCLAWVFFRAKTLPQASVYVSCLLGMGLSTPNRGAVAPESTLRIT